MKWKRRFSVLAETLQEFSNDNAGQLGAALAFYAIFSIAPLLIIAVVITGLIFGQQAATGELFRRSQEMLGPSAAETLQSMIRNAYQSKASTVATVVGIVLLLWGASGVFAQLQTSLNQIVKFEVPKGKSIITAVRERFLAFLMVLFTGALLFLSLIMSTVLSVMARYFLNRLPGSGSLMHWLEFGISLVIVTLLFAMIYRVLPGRKIRWAGVWRGALLASVLFGITKYAMGFYLGRSSVASVYGAAGSLVVLLLWVYVSAQILFVGAEYAKVYSLQRERKAVAEEAEHATHIPQPEIQRPGKPAVIGAVLLITTAVLAHVLNWLTLQGRRSRRKAG